MQLTEQQAYNAMVTFLDNYYDSTKLDSLGVLLSSLMMLEDNKPAIPGVWSDWLSAIESGKDQIKYQVLAKDK